MPSPSKEADDGDYRDSRLSGRESDGDDGPSTNLWVGNLSMDTIDSDLMTLFAKHGVLDCVMTFSSRNFAFLYFKSPDDAKAAKDDLQGALVRGNSIKIEFARPAKPCKQLWISGISSSLTKEQLEEEFSKFGKLEDHKFHRDRNSALIDYYKIDDATAALKSMDGKDLGGEQIRVDYLRTSSQPSKRDWSDHHETRRSFGPESARFIPEASRHPLGGPYESPLSKVLLIRYPPSVRIDEQMLHNAMILFGEIEHVKSFPSRSSSFVEFRSVDEARRAKEGLQGRLFNDPRIQILYLNSEFAQPKDDFLFGSGQGGGGGPRQDMIYGDHPFGRTKYFHRGGYPNNFPGSLPPNNMPGMGRPFPPRGFFDGGSEFLDDSAYHFREGVNFSRLSPVPGRQSPTISLPGMWDGFDARDAKRSRIDGSPFDEASLRGRRMDSQILRNPYALNGPDRVAAGPSSPMGAKRSAAGFPIRDHCWRGIIAKGGTPVCHARCVPVGKGVDSPLPEVVNCSARTGLDMLSKHYEEADGFDIVFFLPDSEDDFASYTEFLQYLRLKNRAGVAKLDDGTTLFLVPPSDFLTQVLKVSGPERLYGVVLKIPQQLGAPTSHYTERQQTPPAQSGYAASRLSEDRVPSLEYSRPLQEELLPRSTAGRPFSAQSLPISYGSNPMTSQPVEVSLTPELIATLAAVIPTSALATSTGPVQPPLSSTVRAPSVSVPLVPGNEMLPQLWSQQPQTPVSSGAHHEQPSLPSLLAGQQFANQNDQICSYTNTATIAQENLSGIQQAPSISVLPFNSYVVAQQGGQFTGAQPSIQSQADAEFSSSRSHGISRPAEAAGLAGAAGPLQPNSAAASSQVQSGNLLQHWIASSSSEDKVNTDFPAQVQQLQNNIPSSATQAPSEADADKNQRYQSTLQLAANLLLQIQQQANSQSVHGSGGHQ